MWANFAEAYFLGTALKISLRRLLTSSIKLLIRHFDVNSKKCLKKTWCTCNSVVLHNKPLAFFTISLPVAVVVAKAPEVNWKRPKRKIRSTFKFATSFLYFLISGP